MPPKIQIIGNEDKAIPYLQWTKNQWKLREGTWYKHTGDCLIQFIRHGDNGFIRLIPVTYRGFITHPRAGTPRGFQFPGHDSAKTFTYGIAHTGKGYTETDNVLTDDGDSTGAQDGQPYPLIDEDATDKHWLFEKDDDWTADGPQQLMYGNVDWKGPAGDDRRILTYKGNPSRYWPVGQFVEIPGLSSVDHSVEGDLNSYEYMTVFGDKVYEGGEVLATMPWLYHPLNSVQGGWEANHQNAHVLGAAIRETDGVLICIVKTCYDSYPTVKAVGEMVSTWQVWQKDTLIQDWYGDKAGAEKQVADSNGVYKLIEVPDPGRGYWIEVIAQKAGDIQGGWKRLLRESTENAWADCNFFFSEDGTKAVSVQLGKVWQIEIDGNSASCITEDAGTFQQVITTTNTNNTQSKDSTEASAGDWKLYNENTKTLRQEKSGTVAIAGDYKANNLVLMRASLTGGNTYTQIIEQGTRWGETAMVPENTEASDRRPYLAGRWGFCDGGGGEGTVAFVVYPGGSCRPRITINGISAEPGECTVLNFPPDCGTPGNLAVMTVEVTLTDDVTGLTATDSGQVRDYRGHWESEVIQTDSQTGCNIYYSGIWFGGTVPQISTHDPLNCYYNPDAVEVMQDMTCYYSENPNIDASVAEYTVTNVSYATSGPIGEGCAGGGYCPEFVVGTYTTDCTFYWYAFKTVTRYRWVC